MVQTQSRTDNTSSWASNGKLFAPQKSLTPPDSLMTTKLLSQRTVQSLLLKMIQRSKSLTIHNSPLTIHNSPPTILYALFVLYGSAYLCIENGLLQLETLIFLIP